MMVFKMEKLFIIESDNQILIQKEIAKIINKTNYEVIKFDLTINSLDDIIETLDTYGLFTTNKIVIGYNPPFLSEKTDINLTKFLKYLNNPSENILILVTSKLNNTLKVVKTIKDYFKIIPLTDINFEKYIQENLEDLHKNKTAFRKKLLLKNKSNYSIINLCVMYK